MMNKILQYIQALRALFPLSSRSISRALSFTDSSSKWLAEFAACGWKHSGASLRINAAAMSMFVVAAFGRVEGPEKDDFRHDLTWNVAGAQVQRLEFHGPKV